MMAGVVENAHTEPWITDELRGLLAAIPEPHARKKRATVIRLAFARANNLPAKPVFDLPETCAEWIWYQKWQYIPEIKAALDACYRRALEWADEETVALEEHYRRERKKGIARFAADAPAALAAVMASREQRGADRINAAVTLIKLSDPETAQDAGPVPAAGSMDQTVNIDAGALDRMLMGLLYERADAEVGGSEPAGVGDSSPAGDPASDAGIDPA